MSEICLQNLSRHYKNLNLYVTTMEAVHLSREYLNPRHQCNKEGSPKRDKKMGSSSNGGRIENSRNILTL